MQSWEKPPPRKYHYRVLPTTWKARLLLIAAFLGGPILMFGWIGLFILAAGTDLFEQREVTYVNRTDETIDIYLDDFHRATIGPGGSAFITHVKLEWWFERTVEARDQEGNVIWSEKIDKDYLDDTGWRIVIDPASTDGECSNDPDGCPDVSSETTPAPADSCEGTSPRICVLPLGEIDPSLTSHLAEHYRDEYGLDVRILAARPIPGELVDPQREQVDALLLADLMSGGYPVVAGDPDVTFIGLTSSDIFIGTSDWRYAFGIREPEAVISTLRMDPEAYGDRANDPVYYSRVRKMLSKYIGVLYYDLPLSDDPTSPMYNNILGPDDLDRMTEPLPVAAP